MSSPSTLIFGCGYLGVRVGRLLSTNGHQVYGTTRNALKADSLRTSGISPLIVDVTNPGSSTSLPAVDRIFHCIGFDRSAGHSIRQVYVEGFARTLDWASACRPIPSIVYASSTGVYGGGAGEWVDETSQVDPRTESGRACFDAERLLEEYPGPSTILRLAGLYGPNRIMRRDSLRNGEPVVGRPDKFLNFIHIDDAAAASIRALDGSEQRSREVFLISDGHPLSRLEFYSTAAELLLAPPPRFEVPIHGTAEASREESNKRIDNRKMLDYWGDFLRYPTIRLGLTASLEAEI